MGVIDSKTFKSGNSVAVRLPKAVGIGPDIPVRIEYEGSTITIRLAKDPAEEKARVVRLVARLKAIGPVGEIERREPFDGPERPGLI
jgi:antitoxin VapB